VRVKTGWPELHHVDKCGNLLLHQGFRVFLSEEHFAIRVEHLERHGDLHRIAVDRPGNEMQNDLLTYRRRFGRFVGIQF